MDDIRNKSATIYDWQSEFQDITLTKENTIDENSHLQEVNRPVNVCIIVPTYNEIHNISPLLQSIYNHEHLIQFSKNNILLNVLFVDDNSPDGTSNEVKTHQKINPNIHLLERDKKEGLGAAYVAGMKYAMDYLQPDIIFEMDGDLSHNPKYILPMIHKIREGADFVIGSRYVKGGSIPEDWGISRKIISRSANFFSKNVLNIKSVNDCTGGFRCMRVDKLRQIDLDSLGTKGYAFQVSLLEEMRRKNAVMKEVPIHFEDRTKGKSKMRFYDMIEGGMFVIKTRINNTFKKNVNSQPEKRKDVAILEIKNDND
jgi:dolichol-phosphate mannosyltransferase